MSQLTHPELVSALCKPGADIAADLNENTLGMYSLMRNIRNFILSGNDLENAKKQAIYNKGSIYGRYDAPCPTPELTPEKAHLLHMAIGIAGEAAEIMEVIYEHVFQDKPLNLTKLVEETGDEEFYLEGLRQGAEITREMSIAENITKLSKRYQSLSYSDSAAQARVDKASS